MTEIYKTIEGYPNYEVSNLGNVKSLNYNHTNKEKVISPTLRNSYHSVQLYNENGFKRCNVHRLVAEAFIPNPNNLPQVNHINENKTDNRVENLEWCTRQYNCNYGERNKKISKGCKKKIIQYSKNGKIMKEWGSLTEASKTLNISLSDISLCCRDKLKSAGGYKWKYTT